MGQNYHQFTEEERIELYALRKAKIKITRIAKLMHKSKSTIYRELNRNSGKRGYRPKQAHEIAMARKSKCHKPTKMTPDVIHYIEKRLKLDWSPEQIANVMKFDKIYDERSVSHECIYQYVWNDKKFGGQLYTHFRHKQKRYRKRGSLKDTRGKIRNRVDIDRRPKIVERRTRIGDWEADLVCGCNQSGYLVTLVDRVNRRVKIGYSKTKTSDAVTKEIISMLTGEIVKTITFDNGKEFAGHEVIAERLYCKCYFAKPYHSWERGLNENTNGLIRQYFSKKMSFDKITRKQIYFVQNRLNTRPRKCLGYKTPNEVYLKIAA